METVRSEWVANEALAGGAGAKWLEPAPYRPRRRTYGVLAIASRHPKLFASLTALVRVVAGH